MEKRNMGRRVCIVRNAESKTNASMIRVLDALLEMGNRCLLLTRSRNNGHHGINQKTYQHKGFSVDEYEISIAAKMGKGLANLLQLVKYQFVVFKWLLRHKNDYDTVHVFDLDAGLPTRFAQIFTKKTYVYHIADFYVDSRGGIPSGIRELIKKLEFSVINHAEATIICTEQRKEQIKGSNPKKLVVVHNTPSITIAPKLNESDMTTHALSCAYVGAISERRFGNQMINAFKNRPKYQLHLAGMGSLENLAEEAGREFDNIHYYGTIDYSQAISLLSSIDAMFAIYDPSVMNHKYSAPNKVYEAMLLGKPIIVAKGTGVDTLVEKEQIGLSIDYEQSAFEDALDYLHDYPAERKKMAERAKMAWTKYSWEEMKNRLIHLYEELES